MEREGRREEGGVSPILFAVLVQCLLLALGHFVLLCEAWAQGQKGADLNGVFISKLFSH